MKRVIYVFLILVISSLTFAAKGPKKPNKTIKLTQVMNKDSTYSKIAYVYKSFLQSPDSSEIDDLVPDGFKIVEKPR